MINKKLGKVFSRFLSILSYIFEKVDQQNIGLYFFKIFKYTFFNILKRLSAKNWARLFLRFVGIAFLNI